MARLSLAASAACILLLAALHVLNPEFDPSFRVVSEYADGRCAWVLSLMFVAWAIGSWALAVAMLISPVLARLILAGLGEAMAAVFDIHHPLHGLAGVLGILGLPAAAMSISPVLARLPGWSDASAPLLWTPT